VIGKEMRNVNRVFEIREYLKSEKMLKTEYSITTSKPRVRKSLG